MSSPIEGRLHSVLTALKSGVHAATTAHEAAHTNGRFQFVTISRQAGAGGKSLGHALAKAMNALHPDEEPWYAWDRELVDRVSDEHHLRAEHVEALENTQHRWFNDFIASFHPTDDSSEFKIFRRTAMTVRALAQGGRAIIVGRGGVFITRKLPGGLHVRLVAPVEHRVERLAHRLKTTRTEATKIVRDADRNREHFYRRYWPDKTLDPETFSLTLNTACLSEEQMVVCLLPLVQGLHLPSENAALWFTHKEPIASGS